MFSTKAGYCNAEVGGWGMRAGGPVSKVKVTVAKSRKTVSAQ